MAEIIVKDAGLIAGLKGYDEKVAAAAGKALGFLGLAFQAEAQANAKGPFNPGGPHIPWSKPGPNVRTGNLVRSIRSTKPRREGFGNYVVGVGPSIYYAAIVENGSSRWGSGVNYPYMKPAYEATLPKAERIFLTAYKRFRGH